MSLGIHLAERGLLPDVVTRYGIRRLLRERLRELDQGDEAADRDAQERLVAALRSGPVAIAQGDANRQHYDVAPDFYRLVLGRHLKYSACWWDDTTADLHAAEAAMLDRYVERGLLADGQDILDVGCGWGSLSLYLADRFPHSRITGLSNSPVQRRWIEVEAALRGLDNLEVVTADLADWDCPGRYDRLVSIECLEHMRNHSELFSRFARWLHPDGLAFIHVFCHRRYCYPFATTGSDDWMGRHFFTGGLMPSLDLFGHYAEHLTIDQQWEVSGSHYARTARAWLERLDAARQAVLLLFAREWGTGRALHLFRRWRIFFMACEELFGYGDGDEWLVGHYRLRPPG